MGRKSFVVQLLAGAALVLAGTASGGTGGLSPLSPDSPNAGRISDVYWLILGFSVAILLLVEGLLIAFVIRFRARGRAREIEGPQIRGHTRLELAWTAVPVLIVAVIAAFVFYKLPGIKNIPSANAAGGRLDVEVEGHQFYWQFTYPNGVVALDDMRVPVGRTVKMDITAPDYDVNHSWWVPELGGKMDAIPGKTNQLWFRALRPGIYPGQCAEFCGIQHAEMRASVNAMPAAAFDAWLRGEARRQQSGNSTLGAVTYSGACSKCHGEQGEGLVGPALKGNPLLANRQGLEEIVRNGRGQMPPVGKDWSDTQFRALQRYVARTLTQAGSSGS